jgi:hypothetical protein
MDERDLRVPVFFDDHGHLVIEVQRQTNINHAVALLIWLALR